LSIYERIFGFGFGSYSIYGPGFGSIPKRVRYTPHAILNNANKPLILNSLPTALKSGAA